MSATLEETIDAENEREAKTVAASTTTSSPAEKKSYTWAIGGGKGGVGKSLISANLSITLAQTGVKVTAVDLDLGCANLHTCLGVDIPSLTLSDFFSN